MKACARSPEGFSAAVTDCVVLGRVARYSTDIARLEPWARVNLLARQHLDRRGGRRAHRRGFQRNVLGSAGLRAGSAAQYRGGPHSWIDMSVVRSVCIHFRLERVSALSASCDLVPKSIERSTRCALSSLVSVLTCGLGISAPVRQFLLRAVSQVAQEMSRLRSFLGLADLSQGNRPKRTFRGVSRMGIVSSHAQSLWSRTSSRTAQRACVSLI